MLCIYCNKTQTPAPYDTCTPCLRDITAADFNRLPTTNTPCRRKGCNNTARYDIDLGGAYCRTHYANIMMED